MAETTQGAALLLDANGNVDRVRTTDGQIFFIASTIAIDSAKEAQDAASACKTAMGDANAAEEKRASAEKTRASNETSRLNAEVTRASNEVARVNAENARKSAESSRQSAETSRASNEKSRVEAEAKRVSAEKQRHDEHIADQQSSSNAAAAASQALQVANSVAQGSAGSSDMAALKRQNAQLFQRLSNLSGEFIYSDGTVYCPSSKATASGDTITFAGSCTASGVTLTLT